MKRHSGRVTGHGNYVLGAYTASVITMCVGYCLFVLGVVSPAWRREIGYTYGLWVRCDDSVCQYLFNGFTNFMAAVQGGIITSLSLLTIAVICAFFECLMRATDCDVKHVTRTGNVVMVTAVIGELLAAASLGFYGCKTVMARDRLPVLTIGFAVTGIGVIVSLIGSILRAMGPTETWGHGMCCLAPRIRYKKDTPRDGTLSSEIYQSPLGIKTRLTSKGNHNDKVGIMSCFHTSKRGYAYSSVPSTISSSLERGYVHYEEISFEDMPPPPLELLNQFPTRNSPLNYQNETLPVSPSLDQICHYTTPSLDHRHSSRSSSNRYVESKPHSQSRSGHQHLIPALSGELSKPHHGVIPQVAPRHINQRRSMVRSAQRQVSSATDQNTNTFTQSQQYQQHEPQQQYLQQKQQQQYQRHHPQQQYQQLHQQEQHQPQQQYLQHPQHQQQLQHHPQHQYQQQEQHHPQQQYQQQEQHHPQQQYQQRWQLQQPQQHQQHQQHQQQQQHYQ